MPCKIHSAKAPNGKRSQLFDNLVSDLGQDEGVKSWVITKTENFQKEFGKTKIKDKNGEPLLMYRGEASGIEKLKVKQQIKLLS